MTFLQRLSELQDRKLPTDWEEKFITLLQKLSELGDFNLPTDWEEKLTFLQRLSELQDYKLPTDWEEKEMTLLPWLKEQLKARALLLSYGKEEEFIQNCIKLGKFRAAVAMTLLGQLNEIEKLPDHENLEMVATKLKHMECVYSQNKKFLYQNVAELFETDDVGQELVELLPKQPDKLVKYFPTINCTDGHQDSKNIALLFGMSSLAPAIILPQQSKIILSHVKLTDILLSLDQFSEVCVQYTWDMM